jgi:hypothetical protein
MEAVAERRAAKGPFHILPPTVGIRLLLFEIVYTIEACRRGMV